MKTLLLLFLTTCAVASDFNVSYSTPESSDVWGKEWTKKDIEDKNFGIAIRHESDRSALAPPPIDDMKITMSYSKKTGESKVTEPTPLQRYLQDEFTNLGWWNFIFLGSIFWLGIFFLWRGDTFGVLAVLVAFVTTFGLMVYAFYER